MKNKRNFQKMLRGSLTHRNQAQMLILFVPVLIKQRG